MALISTLYRCKVYHDRRKPKRNSFSYNIFMFMVDLDELDLLSRRLKLFGHNSFNVFSFYDNDHFRKDESAESRSTVRNKLETFLISSGIQTIPARVTLLTNLRVFGYVFNPVSFYYCHDERNRINCVVVEVSNTYGEMKMYVLQNLQDGYFEETKPKLFYISPFTKLDDHLHLKIGLPGEKLRLFIDDFASDDIKVKTVMTGFRKKLTDWRLLGYALRFPLVTLQIIFLIHWQALRLWLKGVQYIPKKEDMHLQQDIYYTRQRDGDRREE